VSGTTPGYVWRVLRGLGWSLQRPARQARERDEEAHRALEEARLAAGKRRRSPRHPDRYGRIGLLREIRDPADVGAPGEDPDPEAARLQLEVYVGGRRSRERARRHEGPPGRAA